MANDANDTNGDKPQMSVNVKDISDWLKIIALIVAIVLAYARLSNQVEGHTKQLGAIQTEVTGAHKKLDSIEMYLCSRDSKHCAPDNSYDASPQQ